MRLGSLSLTFVALLLPIPGGSKDRQERSSAGEEKGKNCRFLAGGMMAPEYGAKNRTVMFNYGLIIVCFP